MVRIQCKKYSNKELYQGKISLKINKIQFVIMGKHLIWVNGTTVRNEKGKGRQWTQVIKIRTPVRPYFMKNIFHYVISKYYKVRIYDLTLKFMSAMLSGYWRVD